MNKRSRSEFRARTPVSKYENELAHWARFYDEVFHKDLVLPVRYIPRKVAGFERLVVVAAGMHLDEVVETMRSCGLKVSVWQDGGIEASMRRGERPMIEKDYALWTRDSDVPDAALLGQKLGKIRDQDLTQDLIEHLLFIFEVWRREGRLMQFGKSTLCAASRTVDRCIPCVECTSQAIDINRISPGDLGRWHSSHIGARQIVH